MIVPKGRPHWRRSPRRQAYRQIVQEMKILTVLGEEELYAKAKEHGAPTN